MARSIGLAHIIRKEDGTAVGIWGAYTLKSAFQPIFSFRDGRLRPSSYEGLVRPFRNETPVSPGAFFSSVPDVDRFHVETLARTVHILNAGVGLDPTTTLFVNFDPSHLIDEDAVKSALRDTQLVLKEAGLSADRVVCEITEQETRSERPLRDFVTELKACGYRVAVDDFGAESSDMRRIEALGPDIVKFDGQWTGRLLGTGPGVGLLKDMVAEFSAKRIRTVFEGIENGRQLEAAEQCGVSMVQGFALARPQLVPLAFQEFRAALEAAARRPAVASIPSMRPGEGTAERPPAVIQTPAQEQPIRQGGRPAKVFGRRGI